MQNILNKKGIYMDTLNAISDRLGLPKDILNDMTLISVTGSNEITVDNFKNIKEFSDKQIILSTKDKSIILSGTELEISHLTKETVTVKGNFKKMEFG